MSLGKEEILKSQALDEVRIERIPERWLIFGPEKSPYFSVSAFAENLKRALKPRFEINPKVESLSINVVSVKAF
jgi:hypothetical protein